MMVVESQNPDELDDLPITLAEACREIFRDNIKPATLRAEAARGRLVIERIGRRDFVTRRAIREMRELCRVERKPAAGEEWSARRTQAEKERAEASLAAAWRMLEDLKAERKRRPKAAKTPSGK